MPIELVGGEKEVQQPATAEKVADNWTASFVFVNKTGIAIHDMIIKSKGKKDTGKRRPAGPEMVDVYGSLLKADGTEGGEIIDKDLRPKESAEAHVKFDSDITDGTKFNIEVSFKRQFKWGEGVTFIPTSQTGAAINSSVTPESDLPLEKD